MRQEKKKGQSPGGTGAVLPDLAVDAFRIGGIWPDAERVLNLMDDAGSSPFSRDNSPFIGATDNDDLSFYMHCPGDPLGCLEPGLAEIAVRTIAPYNLDSTLDDIVISVVSVKDDTIFHRYPDDVGVRSAVAGASDEYSYYGNKKSKFTDASINTILAQQSGVPKTGIVIVEMWYSYHQELALPWIIAFYPIRCNYTCLL